MLKIVGVACAFIALSAVIGYVSAGKQEYCGFDDPLFVKVDL